MDLDTLKRELEAKDAMRAVAQSAEAKKLMEGVDAAAVETAVKSGDTAALKGILANVLSTPEGRALAEKVRKAVGQDG